jgi:imidazolonepropionase-like amidohydrolase
MAQNEAREVTQTYVIKNAMVVQKPGTILPSTHVVIRNGLIEAIGAQVAIPFDAQIIDADSMYVYAGFIDAASHTGIPKKEERRERPQDLDPSDPPNDLAGITPYQKATDVIDTKEKSIEDMRDNGFTMSHVVPSGRMLPGKGAIILNKEGSIADITLADETAMFSQFSPAQRMYPATTIAVMSKWRDLYTNAKYQSTYASKFELNPSGMQRPVMDDATEALVDVVNGNLSVFFKADNALDIHRAIKLQNDLGMKLVLVDVEQAYPAMDIIKAKNIPLILSPDLPKEEKKKDDKKDEEKKDAETTALEKRKMETIEKYVGQAGMLEKNGVKFAFSFLDAKVKDFKPNVKRMIDAGLTEDGALAAMTTTPASMIGMDKMAGTVEKGKIANLVITDKPYFDEKSNIRYVIVDGNVKEYEVKAKKKKSNGGDGEPVALDGEWSFEIEIPGQTQTGTIVVSKNGDGFDIKFASSDEPDDYTDASNVSLDGNNLTFDAAVDNGGFTMNLNFDLEIDGNSYEGTVTAGNMGTFPMSGDKISAPE